MKMTKKYNYWQKYVVVSILIAGLLIDLKQEYKNPINGLYEELKATLYKQEKIIDYVKVEDSVYTLISKNGTTEYGDLLGIYRQGKNAKWERIYQNDFNGLKPWKLEIADIDGDEEQEILVAVYKTTHFDDHERNRMFIFNYDPNKLYKKWTGSQIAGNWKDFYVGDLLSIEGSELIFIEQMESEKERIGVYYWFDFGFILLATSESYSDIQNVSILGENSIQITCKVNKKEETIILTISDGEIIEVITQ